MPLEQTSQSRRVSKKTISHMACLPSTAFLRAYVHDGAPAVDDQPVAALRALHARRHARRHLRAALLQLRAPAAARTLSGTAHASVMT